MQLIEFNSLVDELIQFCTDLLNVKGKEYMLNNDRLSHFKEAGTEQEINSKQALWGMLAKHLISLKQMCQNGLYSQDIWKEKIADSINYLILLMAIVKEEFEDEQDSNTST